MMKSENSVVPNSSVSRSTLVATDVLQVFTTIFDMGEAEIEIVPSDVNFFWSIRVSLGSFVVFLLHCCGYCTLFCWVVNQGMQVNELASGRGSKIGKPN